MTQAQLNNNPLNIRAVDGVVWRGQQSAEPGVRRRKSKFVRFVSVEWGLRAAFCILRTYARKYHIRCIRDIVSRWAPPSENDTGHYVENLCRWTGYGGQQCLTEAEWPLLVKAMARQESGITLSDSTIARAFTLYKLYP